MMSKTEMIRARIEPDLKNEVENIFSELGLSPTTAINMFYRQVKLLKGLPFTIRIPNETTIQTFNDTDEGKNIILCEDTEDMFNKLGI
ncbi:type II toxin-antitoxin system RelB/DinJ family antitoxin [candidate division KSB1 bacterium]|nr:type II toxin-antitoxin system RelB/DinJ family antitoxin [candidate division KSB1 bacterium]